MSEKVYSYVVIGMITGEHFLEDLKIRVPYRTPVPITEADFLNSKDLNRAIQQGYVKCVAQASIPAPPTAAPVSVQGLERKVEDLQNALRASETARRDLEQKIDGQAGQLQAILDAIQKIPTERTVVVQGGGSSNGSVKSSDVVGGEAPMFIPSNIEMGDAARISAQESQGEANLGEAAKKLRELRQRQGAG